MLLWLLCITSAGQAEPREEILIGKVTWLTPTVVAIQYSGSRDPASSPDVATDRGKGAVLSAHEGLLIARILSSSRTLRLQLAKQRSASFPLTEATLPTPSSEPGSVTFARRNEVIDLLNQGTGPVVGIVPSPTSLDDVSHVFLIAEGDSTSVTVDRAAALTLFDLQEERTYRPQTDPELALPEYTPPVPPEPPGWRLNTAPFSLEGAALSVFVKRSNGLELDEQTFFLPSPPGSPWRITFDELELKTQGTGLEARFGVLEASLSIFTGTVDANTKRTGGGGSIPVGTTFSGKVDGAQAEVFWPAFQYRRSAFRASIGPELGVAHFRVELDDLDPSILLPAAEESLSLTSITPGLRARMGFKFSRFTMELQGSGEYPVGQLATELLWDVGAAVGYTF